MKCDDNNELLSYIKNQIQKLYEEEKNIVMKEKWNIAARNKVVGGIIQLEKLERMLKNK